MSMVKRRRGRREKAKKVEVLRRGLGGGGPTC
jgi:hypothetical protein